jgi:hypothetical protein
VISWTDHGKLLWLVILTVISKLDIKVWNTELSLTDKHIRSVHNSHAQELTLILKIIIQCDVKHLGNRHVDAFVVFLRVNWLELHRDQRRPLPLLLSNALDTTLCDKDCQWISPVSSTNKIDCHNIAEILLKVTTITLLYYQSIIQMSCLELTILVVIGTDCIGNSNSNNHTITTITAVLK